MAALAFIPLYIKYLGIEAYGLIGIFALLPSLVGAARYGNEARSGQGNGPVYRRSA